MKTSHLVIFLILGFSLPSFGQEVIPKVDKPAAKLPSNGRHFVSLVLGNVLYFSLEDNDNTGVSAQKQLVINSNIPFNVVINENYTETVSYGFIPDSHLIEETHGPAVSQLTSVKRIKYFRDSDKVRFLTSLLYTAAPL
ncbi:MAG: hypothetical protein JWP69_824 [Flaviaesturariibacter sp.]|nr:hypothetical protein [Flaviaesturariibacter sp.]